MRYTEQDLLLAERTVAALEKFVIEQKRRFAAMDPAPDQRRDLDLLLEQFHDVLEWQRARRREIRNSLASHAE
jgi:hypothetical protein